MARLRGARFYPKASIESYEKLRHVGGLQHRLNVFLMAYRRTPNITTGESPSKRFLQREIRSKLDILKPDVVRDVADQLRKSQVSFMDRSFNVGDPVAVRDYRTL
ncbi:Hypothetical protein NTJ_11430 [Nesidiocoris tenuis]|uniref:Uncharacterized protein n=1 Tax=Nesidiocoris tenuis TaxID=355587 RepID=A0ABN7B429_9HEMI|nr:Hypothetical protein NTJ_11430 [Nesidiocoris tenuis]